MPLTYQHTSACECFFSSPHLTSLCDNPTAAQQRGGGEKEGFLPTTERLTSAQRNNAAIWLPAKMANCHLVICGDAYNVQGHGLKSTSFFQAGHNFNQISTYCRSTHTHTHPFTITCIFSPFLCERSCNRKANHSGLIPACVQLVCHTLSSSSCR